MQSKHSYSQLVKAFIKEGFLTGVARKGTLGLTLPTPKIIGGRSARPGSYPEAHMDFANDSVDLDAKELSPQEKYFGLLEISFKTYRDAVSSKKKSEEDAAFIQEFKAFLDKEVDKKEGLFVFLYVMSEGVLATEERARVLKEVMSGKMTAQQARNELRDLAYKAFASTDKNEIKQGCAKIISAALSNTTDLVQVTKNCKFDEKGVSEWHDYFFYAGRAQTHPEYLEYKKTLENLDGLQKKRVLPETMSGMFHALALEANKLYLDNQESDETKANCHQLMTELDEFGIEFVKMRDLMDAAGYKTKADVPASETHLLNEIKKIEKMSEKIDDSINQLSADTSSKRWGVIALFSAIIVALGAISSGVGFGIGLSKMVSSIRSDSQFFKINKEHHTVVTKAREIIKVTNPVKLTLNLTDEQRKKKAIEEPRVRPSIILPGMRGSMKKGR